MHALSTADQIGADCQILLDRALKGKRVCAFGEDGQGQHGRNSQALWYTVRTIDVYVICDDEDLPSIIQCYIHMYLEGYDSLVTGHIATDKNFDIRCKELLKVAGIDEDVLSWPPDVPSVQGRSRVILDVNVGKLLDWV